VSGCVGGKKGVDRKASSKIRNRMSGFILTS
jgi:hypothetical protein